MSDYIGEIGNMYGGLMVKEEQGKYFWAIDDVHDLYWQEIPESLYRELVKFGRGQQISNWIEWNGGECPIIEVSVVLEVKFRNGRKEIHFSDQLYWKNLGISTDIIAYRIL